MFKKSYLVANLALIFTSAGIGTAFAQTENPSSLLDEVVVSTSKYPQKQSETAKVVTVISKEIIQKNGGKTLTELLNQQAGLTIIGSQNNLGHNQDVYLRGASGGYTVILINGSPVYDPSSPTNAFDMNLISLEMIERVEILKGGHSTLYGSDAVAGVINIITKKPENQPLHLSAGLAGGSYNTYKGNVGLAGKVHQTSYSLQYNYLTSQGFSDATQPANSTKSFDNDGIKQHNLNLFVEQQLTKKLTWKGQLLWSRYKTDLDLGAFQDEQDYTFTSKNLFWGTGLVYQFAKGKLTLNYNQNNNDRLFLNDSTFLSSTKFSEGIYKAQSNFIEAYSNIDLSNLWGLLVGVEHRWQNTDQSYLSVSAWGPYATEPLNASTAQTRLFSAYASLSTLNSQQFGLEIGGRYNNHSFYGNNFTYTFNPFVLIKQQHKVFLNVSSSFKAPSLYQLYSPYGTPNLKPEVSRTMEFGTQVFSKNKKANLRVVYFDRQVKDVITYVSITLDPWGQYVNFDQQHDNGVEIEGQWKHQKWTLSTNYTYVDGAIKTKTSAGKDTTYMNLFRRPRSSFNASVGYQALANWYVQASVRSVGKAASGPYDDPSITLGSYTTLDLYQEFHVAKKYKIFLDIKNITNQEVIDIPGFNARKRNFMFGITYQW